MFGLDKTHEKKMIRMINIKNRGMAKTSKSGIKKMSIEVEGAFSKKPLKYDHDPSVSVESDYITNSEGVKTALHNYFGESKSLICATAKRRRRSASARWIATGRAVSTRCVSRRNKRRAAATAATTSPTTSASRRPRRTSVSGRAARGCRPTTRATVS